MAAHQQFHRVLEQPSATLLNGRKQVSQGFLELFRFFHNTHRFVRGQRAGFSPLELAGGPHVDDPLAFLSLGAKS